MKTRWLFRRRGWRARKYPEDRTWCWVTDGVGVWLGWRDVAGCWWTADDGGWLYRAKRIIAWQPLKKPKPPVAESTEGGCRAKPDTLGRIIGCGG